MKAASTLLCCLLLVTSAAYLHADEVAEKKRQADQELAMQLRYLPLAFQGCVFHGNEFPKCDFVNPQLAKQLLGEYEISVDYYDAQQEQVDKPTATGRYGAVVTISGDNRWKLTRYRTLYRSPGEFGRWTKPRGGSLELPDELGIAEAVSEKQAAQIGQMISASLSRDAFRANDLAVLLAGLSETDANAASADSATNARAMDRAWWLRISRKLNGNAERFADIEAPLPKTIDGDPARVLREGTPAEAGMRHDAAERIDRVLSDWAADTDEPFIACVARRGVIVLHKAYKATGEGANAEDDVTVETKNFVASITKALSGSLAMMFVDRGIVSLDDPVEKYLPEFDVDDVEKSATLHHLFTHTAGMESHDGDGSVDLEHVYGGKTYSLLDVGARHQYNGDSLGIGTRVLEQLAGKTLPQLYKQCLFEPLGCDSIDAANSSWDARATALDLARVGQMLANRGAYGDRRFFSEATFQKMLPASLDHLFGKKQPTEWGIGLTWFDDQVIGHGSATSCTLRIDLKNDLVVTMSRGGAGKNFDKYHDRFIKAVEASIALPVVHPLFADHMVVQRDKKIPVWGWSYPGQQVSVSIDGKTTNATVDESGTWQATIGPLSAGGPHTLAIDAHENVVVDDVLVGDVWICSGQSNMQWSVANSDNADEEIAAADHPQIRLFQVPLRTAISPQETVDGQWKRCSPKSIPSFSAVGYYFGRSLNEELGVPIGLINSSWGGTIAEAWTSGDALEQMDDFRAKVAEVRKAAASDGPAPQYEQRVAQWWRRGDRNNDADRLKNPDYDDDAWKEMALPGQWETANVGLDDYDGIVWYRREFDVPDDWLGKDARLNLGPVDDVDTTWINGRRVGGMNLWNQNRSYPVPAAYLKPGRNVVAIRVYDHMGGGGLYGSPEQLTLVCTDDNTIKTPLTGLWRFKATTPKEKLPGFPQPSDSNPNVVTVLYNGMVAPLTPFGIKGAIWYQGESNAGRPEQYRRLLPTMIADWRNRFDQGDFPFLIVQLANFMKVQDQPVENGWAELREAQALTAADDPKVGLAVITDIGEANDIHPRNKQDVGRRLARQAREIAYGQDDVVASGPTFKHMNVEGSQLRLTFDGVGDGLATHGDKLQGFAIAGPDGKYKWADAEVDGNEVILTASEVASPVAARYNWANNPIGNLFNEEGLPAAPFRTDLQNAD